MLEHAILIIDDAEANRYTFARILQRAGYKTLEAASVAEGVAFLESHKIQLIILDVQLPDGNGFELCTQWKQTPSLASIPVLMTSASFIEGRDRAQGLDCGADGYLITPIDPLELVATVKALLRIHDMERTLREAREKAEAANTAKTDFLANMSHEIRTPMNAIIGLTNILARTPLSEQQQKFVTTLQESSDSLMRLINDMLDIAKIEDNMIELESISFSLHELIERIVGMMSVEANKKQLTLAYQPGTIPAQITGDPQRLHQVVLNIVSNAVKFTHEGGIRIDTSVVAGATGRNQVRIRVTDTGVGIPLEKRDMIFNKFTQADSSVTRKYGGSGLGLTIARKLIEHMGGQVEVESKVGQGSIFTILLPLHGIPSDTLPATPTEIPADYEAHTRLQGCILLVEDHAPNVLVATTLLESFGYQYSVAANGIEALEQLKEKRFDAVLMDIQMHDMDGYEATRHLRDHETRHQLPHLPVIAMTAHVLTGDREKCLDAGMDDYISKPINAAELQKKLSRFIKARAG